MALHICSRRPVGDARASRREAATDSSTMKKKLKVLVLFDGTSPTTVDQDFSDELKTKEWKTEADVMKALGALGHTPEHLATQQPQVTIPLMPQGVEHWTGSHNNITYTCDDSIDAARR